MSPAAPDATNATVKARIADVETSISSLRAPVRLTAFAPLALSPPPRLRRDSPELVGLSSEGGRRVSPKLGSRTSERRRKPDTPPEDDDLAAAARSDLAMAHAIVTAG